MSLIFSLPGLCFAGGKKNFISNVSVLLQTEQMSSAPLPSFTCLASKPWSPTLPYNETLLPRHDAPRANQIVRVAGEQGLTVGAPGEADALGLAALLADGGVLGLELLHLALLLQVEDDDGTGGGGAEPVTVGREGEGVHLVAGGQGVEVLGLVQVPQHRRAVLAA